MATATFLIGWVSIVAVSRWEVLGFGGIVGLVLIGSGVLVDRVAHRAATGKLERNKLAGIRSTDTMASDEAWLAAHQAGQVPTRLGGLAAIVGGIAAAVIGIMTSMESLTPNRGMALSAIAIFAAAAVMTVLVLIGAKLGIRAARKVS